MRKKSLSLIKLTLTYTLICSLFACGGGSSSNSGMIVEGMITQGETVVHTSAASVRHAENENIEEVEICVLGSCSTTDSLGQWGMRINESFRGGTAEFSIKGHGIDAVKVVMIPEGAAEVFIHFEHGVGNDIKLHHMLVDGVTVSESNNHEG